MRGVHLPRALCTLSLSALAHLVTNARRVLFATFWRGWEKVMARVKEIMPAARRSRLEEGLVTLRFPWHSEVDIREDTSNS
ncbi:hypothetical protein EI94DRAFT_812880 [Lactarius quietus]|nr:hypothetical protein EI94DRAFT_812880 [Lactarius quietus]